MNKNYTDSYVSPELMYKDVRNSSRTVPGYIFKLALNKCKQ
jgi:hypothetical protein